MSQCHTKKFQIQARQFHIVANEKSLPELSSLISFLQTKPLRYILCRIGKNKKGNDHAHIYVAFTKPVRLSSKSTFGCHIAKCRGTPQENVNYIKSHHPVEVIEVGNLPEGKENVSENWEQFVENLKKGVVDKYSKLYARYESYANKRLTETKPKKTYSGDLKCKNLWLWGDARSGKSYWVHNFLPYDVYDKPPNKWWDGYNDEKVVVLEDLDPEQAKYIAHYIKKWGDRYPITAAVKGGSIRLCPSNFHFIVTSQYSIDQCFNETDVEAIKERFEVWEIRGRMPNLPE